MSMGIEITKERPLAPAPLPVLAGVFAFVVAFLFLASHQLANDWLAVFACLAILGLASVVLDRIGRRTARSQPHPLWYDQRLPTEKSIVKNTLVLLVLLVLIFTAIETARPNDFGNPFPYFVAASFLYLVVPQIMARRIRRRHDAESKK